MEERLNKFLVDQGQDPPRPSLIKHYLWYVLVRNFFYSIFSLCANILIDRDLDKSPSRQPTDGPFKTALYIFLACSLVVFCCSTFFFKELRVA